METPLLSRQLYTDATPTSIAAVYLGTPRVSMVQHFMDSRQITVAEMAAALRGLQWCIQEHLTQPTNITLFTDSVVVYHTLVKGTGLTLRASSLLQDLFVNTWIMKNKAGHGLVVRWVPSEQNLADPLSREIHSPLA
jgi:ribonuclease HI